MKRAKGSAPEVLEEGEGEARDEVRLGGGVADVLAERRGLPAEEAAAGAWWPRPRGLHGRRGPAAAAGGVAPREERARLVDGDAHCGASKRPAAARAVVVRMRRFESAFGRARRGWVGAGCGAAGQRGREAVAA